MTYPLDKLGLINQALLLCGDNTCNVPDDGSDEWNVASAAYEAAIEYMVEDAGWKGLTAIASLPRAGDSPDDQFSDAYDKPQDCAHLIWVRLNLSGQPANSFAVIYRIIGNQICCNANGEPPPSNNTTPGQITIKYVSVTNLDPANGYLTRTFMTALLAFVRAGIYGGLHEDAPMEQAWLKTARGIMAEARSRSDQEEPKRAMFNHRLRAARRIRRPWPQVSNEWGGTGTPGIILLCVALQQLFHYGMFTGA